VLHIDQYYAALAPILLQRTCAHVDVVPDWWYSAFVVTDDVRTNKREAVTRFMTR